MVDIDQIRHTQEQRLLPVLQAWDDAKSHLEDAIARAKAKEQEFHEISEDVRRNIAALDLVTSMATGQKREATATNNPGMEAHRPVLIAPPAAQEETRPEIRRSETAETSTRAFGGLLRKSSRPLFPNMQRSA